MTTRSDHQVKIPDARQRLKRRTADRSVVAQRSQRANSEEQIDPNEGGQNPPKSGESTKPEKKSSSLRFMLLVVIPLLAAVLGIYFYLQGGRYVTTENAYVKAEISTVSADISGRALSVEVKNNQPVSKGDVLFRIETKPLELRLQETEALLKLSESEIEALRAEYAEANMVVAEAQDRIAFLGRQFARQKALKNKGGGSAKAYDEARSELNAGRQRVRVLQQSANRILTELGGDSELAFEQHPSFMKAQAQREQILADINDAVVRAPADGIISNMKLYSGEYVGTGEPIFSLIQTGNLWIEANLKETQLTHIQEGQSAIVTVDAYPGVEWKARVSAIAPATGAEFSLLPPQNATGNWVKVVQRVPVTLELDSSAETENDEEPAPVLRAGMTATIKIDTEHKRTLFSE